MQPSRHARTSSGAAVDPGIARDLSELARNLQAETDQAALLQQIVDAAVYEIDGADHAGIWLIFKRRLSTAARTSDLAAQIDTTQYELKDGPCLTSVREESTVRSDDLRTETRWPRFAQAATGLGIRSVLSVQLFVEGNNLGALNLYAEKPNAFDEAAEDVGLLLASHAAVAIVGERKARDLRTALESRDVIGQAKGILMERFKVDANQAFAMLVAVSQHHHRKLTVVAERLAATGELPDISNR